MRRFLTAALSTAALTLPPISAHAAPQDSTFMSFDEESWVYVTSSEREISGEYDIYVNRKSIEGQGNSKNFLLQIIYHTDQIDIPGKKYASVVLLNSLDCAANTHAFTKFAGYSRYGSSVVFTTEFPFKMNLFMAGSPMTEVSDFVCHRSQQ